MAVIVTRITNPTGGTAKGSPLTSVEIDANFNNINDAKAEYPTQTGNADKYLQTNGSTASWATVQALPSQTSHAGQYLTSDGTNASWALLGNAATVTTNANLTGGVTSVGNAATVVTNANLTGGVTSVGNAATVITNANLTGMVTSVGNAASLGSFTSAQLATALTDETGSGANVFGTSPTIASPTFSGQVSVAQSTSLINNGINLNANGSGYLRGTANDGSSSTVANVQLMSWDGIGFSPSITGQTVPQGENAVWIGCRTGTLQARSTITAASFSGAGTGLTGVPLTTGVTGTLPVANGGTGVTTGTGTGANVFATSPTITTPIIVQSINAQTTAAYVTVASDAGAIVTVSNVSANTFKLPTNASVPYAIGSTITLIQIGAGATTISAVTPATTIVLSTGATAASPVLAQYKSATCIKTGTDAWYIVGALA